MPSKKQKTKEELLRERIKLEIAEELGLLDKIRKGGWGELSAVEAGKIGGLLSSRLKK
ncbi:MAG: small, acid-soluble spore protein, alpha/beta type [Bacillota bacterium]